MSIQDRPPQARLQARPTLPTWQPPDPPTMPTGVRRERPRADHETNEDDRPVHPPAPLSAQYAAARFQIVAGSEDEARDAASLAPTHVALSAFAGPGRPELYAETRRDVAPVYPAAAVQSFQPHAGRLPSTWYTDTSVMARAPLADHRVMLVRGGAVACLISGAAMLVWLGSGNGAAPPAPNLMAGFTPVEIVPAAATPPRSAVPTAQILAVAERFVATGDILAARAMLADTAARGDPRALFMLAETYDPNLLAAWSARDVEPNTAYARLLYDGARRGGMADAQSRLDALR